MDSRYFLCWQLLLKIEVVCKNNFSNFKYLNNKIDIFVFLLIHYLLFHGTVNLKCAIMENVMKMHVLIELLIFIHIHCISLPQKLIQAASDTFFQMAI